MAKDSDKELFSLIKKKVLEYVVRDGHDYTPVKGEFRASSVGYCSRKILLNKSATKYLESDDIEKLPDWIQLEILNDGKRKLQPGAHISGQAIHEIVQTALQNDIIGMEEEVSFDGPSFRLVGHYDLLMENNEGKKIVIDIKSTSSPRAYLPNKSHLTQLMAYQGMLGGIDGALFYIRRNNWEMTYFPQNYVKDKFSLIITKLSHLSFMEGKNTLPEIDDTIFETECNPYFRCPYFNYCFPDYVEPEENNEE
ncbi:MAG: PD-(D/E)XK nuclease family protein [Candidatus Heimdallarchaeota archaeon]|nr:PD-(D/E)XK nuclease family protein [Candidatus Heimdallarchaeota archaeon]